MVVFRVENLSDAIRRSLTFDAYLLTIASNVNDDVIGENFDDIQ